MKLRQSSSMLVILPLFCIATGSAIAAYLSWRALQPLEAGSTVWYGDLLLRVIVVEIITILSTLICCIVLGVRTPRNHLALFNLFLAAMLLLSGTMPFVTANCVINAVSNAKALIAK